MLVCMFNFDCVASKMNNVIAFVPMQFAAVRFAPRLKFEGVDPVHKTTFYFKLLLTRLTNWTCKEKSDNNKAVASRQMMHRHNIAAHQPCFGKPSLLPSPLKPLVATETKSVHFCVFANVRL